MYPIILSIDFNFFLIFRDYVTKFKNTDESFEDLIQDETFFRTKLTQFLFSPRGAIYQVINIVNNQHLMKVIYFTSQVIVIKSICMMINP